jgi:hypothetical protein
MPQVSKGISRAARSKGSYPPQGDLARLAVDKWANSKVVVSSSELARGMPSRVVDPLSIHELAYLGRCRRLPSFRPSVTEQYFRLFIWGAGVLS